MSVKLIRAGNVVDAWKLAAEYILEHGDAFNLVIDIQRGAAADANEIRRYNPKKFLATARSNEDVANTIFPKESKYWNANDKIFYDHYVPAYRTLLRHGPRSWGMYFLRLVDFGELRINQLERVVAGMSSWGHNHKAAFTIHFSSSETDAPRPQGAPCLQYCEFVQKNGVLSLMAVYRSHDYYTKALGNFLGLSRLLRYVAGRTNLQVGSIVCHSTYAFLGASKLKTKNLLAEGL
jgi:thymidylate synthase